MRPRARLVVATLLLASCCLVPLSAYVTIGHVWGKASVPYKINPANDFMIASADLIAAVQAGATQWGTTAAQFAFSYGGTTSTAVLANDGQNNVFFRNDTNGSYIAETWWWYDATNHLVDFDTVFHEGLVPMFVGSTGCSGGIYITLPAMHEFGHGLGLWHSDDSTAVMTASQGYCDPRSTLGADDIAGVTFLYPPSSGSSGTPSTPPATTSVPGQPSAPSPKNSGSAARHVNLSWTAGAGATLHDVYFGPCTATAPLYAINLTSTTLSLSTLNALTAYCWRVVERNSAGDTAGPLWTFTTRKN
jgi:hypothetical protein